jgi:hypothetical protein
MITLLENVLKRTDGAYVDAQDFRLLDHALSTWNARKEAYIAVEQKETEIINGALTVMRNGAQSKAMTVNALNSSGVDRCERDMTAGLRMCALAMLLKDEDLLKDRFFYWQQNIMLAMQHTQFHGYKFLWQSIQAHLTTEQAELMSPYMKMAHEMMSGK